MKDLQEFLQDELEFQDAIKRGLDMATLRRMELVEMITQPIQRDIQVCVSAAGTQNAEQACHSAGNTWS